MIINYILFTLSAMHFAVTDQAEETAGTSPRFLCQGILYWNQVDEKNSALFFWP